MKKKNVREQNIGNKGMTLVEVIVAMTVLTIIIIPVMRSFVYSARYNAKAHELQKATVAAQTIMENFKAYAVEDICQQFADGNFMVGSESTIRYYETVHDPTTFQHTYLIGDISYNGNVYDARVTLTPSASLAPTPMNTYTDSDAYCDAVYMVEAGSAYDIYNTVINEVQTAWSALTDKADTEPEDFDLENIVFEREVEINIDSAGKTTVAETYAYSVASYEYNTESGTNTFSYSGHVMLDNNPSDGIDSPKIIYDNSATLAESGGRAKLKNIYYYFYPLYTSSASDHWIDSDRVVVNSSYGENINFYAIKQKSSISETELEIREKESYNSERIHFTLNGQLIMYDNLRVNVGKPEAGAVTITNPTLSGGATRTGSMHPDTSVLNKALLYDIEVKLFKGGAIQIDAMGTPLIDNSIQPISILTGTIND